MTRFVCLGLMVIVVSLKSATASAEEAQVQEKTMERGAKNSLYIELGGNAGLYSLNYERFLLNDAAVRIGAMYLSVSASGTTGTSTTTASASWFAAPLMFSYLGIGSANHKLEMGAGVVLMHLSAGASTFDATANAQGFLVAGTGTLGYRYVPMDGGFNFKAGFTPLFLSSGGKTYFLPWAGLSVGYGF